MSPSVREAAESEEIDDPITATDLTWAIDEDIPPGPYPRDSLYFFERVRQAVTEAATRGREGRVLDWRSPDVGR